MKKILIFTLCFSNMLFGTRASSSRSFRPLGSPENRETVTDGKMYFSFDSYSGYICSFDRGPASERSVLALYEINRRHREEERARVARRAFLESNQPSKATTGGE